MPEYPDFLTVGLIERAWGLKGHLKARVLASSPSRFLALQQVSILGQRYQIEEARTAGAHVFLKLEGLDRPEDVEQLHGAEIEIPRDEAAPLPPEAYYQYQIVGLDAVTEEGAPLGKVVDVLETPANDVYVVRSELGEILIPAIEDAVRDIDLEAGILRVAALPGLLAPPRRKRSRLDTPRRRT